MGFIALLTWSGAALAGLYMLAVWLIENDVTKRGASASRLPVPVVITHLLLAVTGLLTWVAYLMLDEQRLAWAALGTLVLIALLGLTMFARWIPVYRGTAPLVPVRGGPAVPGVAYEPPPEGSFPVFMVLAHGALAVTTLVLVLLTTLGVAGS